MSQAIIVAATKNRSIKEIEQIDSNIKIIGENKVQEAAEKFPKLKRHFEKHFLGHLQSNKVKQAIKLFDVIQTIDSLKIANKLNQAAVNQNKVQKIMLQINISNDPQKYGFKIENLNEILHEISSHKNLKIIGLMTIPQKSSSKQTKTDFQKMNHEFLKFKSEYNLQYLSMGMSNDYEIAIEEGANMIRLGRILFEKDYDSQN